MSQHLAELLDRPKEEVAKWVQAMETRTGHKGQDIRFLTDMDADVRKKIAGLGLDPADTTSQELYHALKAKYGRDAAVINKALGADEADFNARQDLAISLVNHIVSDAQCWALRNSSLKAVLKDLPPKRLMKAWGYRSVDSLLKREDAAEVALVAQQSEPTVWQRKFAAAVRKAGHSGYRLGPARIIKLKTDRSYGNGAYLYDAQLGVVALNPAKAKESSVLSLTLGLIKTLEKISLRFDAKPLAKVNPTLAWWQGAEHLLLRTKDAPVSLNIHDVSQSHEDNQQFGEHSFSAGAESLLNKLSDSYEALAAQVSSGSAELEAKVDKSINPVQDLALEAVEA